MDTIFYTVESPVSYQANGWIANCTFFALNSDDFINASIPLQLADSNL